MRTRSSQKFTSSQPNYNHLLSHPDRPHSHHKLPSPAAPRSCTSSRACSCLAGPPSRARLHRAEGQALCIM